MDRQSHWENIYKTKKPDQVSWFKSHLSKSFELISKTNIAKDSPVIDIGGGASTLVDDLLNDGITNVTVLDVSSESLEVSKKRLGKQVSKVHWLAADVTTVDLPKNHYVLWHDRAVFHFLTERGDREKYKQILNQALTSKGFVIISSFSLTGPEKCSGLEVVRYSPETLLRELGSGFKLLESENETHKTPFNTTQDFVYCLMQRN